MRRRLPEIQREEKDYGRFNVRRRLLEIQREERDYWRFNVRRKTSGDST